MPLDRPQEDEIRQLPRVSDEQINEVLSTFRPPTRRGIAIPYVLLVFWGFKAGKAGAQSKVCSHMIRIYNDQDREMLLDYLDRKLGVRIASFYLPNSAEVQFKTSHGGVISREGRAADFPQLRRFCEQTMQGIEAISKASALEQQLLEAEAKLAKLTGDKNERPAKNTKGESRSEEQGSTSV